MSDYLYYISYLIAFCNLLLYAYSYKRGLLSKKYKYFVIFLITMFSVDFSANILYEISEMINYEEGNLFIYSILIFFEFNLLFFFYKRISEDIITKKLIKIFIIIFNLIFIGTTSYYVFESLFIDNYNYYAFISGSILIAIILLMFFREFLISNKILNYKKDLSFWITSGLLFYYLASVPVSLLLGYSTYETVEEKNAANTNYTLIQFYVGLFMYACFLSGIFWSRKKIK